MVGYNICLCSGQGSFSLGMGNSLYKENLIFKNSIDRISDAFHISIPDLSWGNLRFKTKNNAYYLHIVLWAFTYGLYLIIKNQGIHVDLLLGHSLGEVFAYFLSGSLNFDDIVHLLSVRGELFYENSRLSNSDMIALVGEKSILDAVVDNYKFSNDVFPANYNSSEQVVFAVSKNNIESFITHSKKLGVKKAVQLNINNGCHSPFVKNIGKIMENEISSVTFQKPKIPILSAVNTSIISTADELKSVFLKHICSPVLWDKTVKQLCNYNDIVVYNLSFSSVLKNLIRLNTVNVLKFVDF